MKYPVDACRWAKLSAPVLWLLCLTSAHSLAAEIDFVRDVRPIFRQHCYSCHGPEKQKSGLRLDVKSLALRGGELYGAPISLDQPAESLLIKFVGDPNADLKMPPEGPPLSEQDVATLTAWITQGAHWPEGVDEVTLEDRYDHWSLKPVAHPAPPDAADSNWPRNPIDQFVLDKLRQQNLTPSLEVDRRTWIRRVSFDLLGLPPTWEQVVRFEQDQHADAYERVVEELLASPHYGERWAQHWLDVVRYADTHGFEVNTERPHAWPYRDYVIDALNRDLPYDQFLTEQIVGDATHQDAATGFLLTASVLLPGQVGADEPSKRLARQDALDEIVVNIGQTFLGLTIGCARCHDHKFDPISQQDYYAMQAFVAGVEYAERELRTPQANLIRQQIWDREDQLEQLERDLARFAPLARVGEPVRTPNPVRNEINFPPLLAQYVRLTIHNVNLHPSLGLIEPCIDELEIYSSGETQRNVALAQAGAIVTASGSNISEKHRLEHINDGEYGNSRSWMSNEVGQGWVLFEFPDPVSIQQVVWGRDRLGEFTDRLATAYTLEAGETLETMQTLAAVQPPRPAINPRRNVDRISPVLAQRLRFTIKGTNNLEPCIDELEILNEQGDNIALASSGATVTSSGDNTIPHRHELRFINDGEYGNSRSWMSNEMGGGWVEFEFPQAERVERIVWGRDREGEFHDRLALEYTIEILTENSEWKLVASSHDRLAYDSEKDSNDTFPLAGLTGSDLHAARNLLDEQKTIKQEISGMQGSLMVFSGTFRKPDDIHLLRRGDPEQPLDPVSPAIPHALGTLQLDSQAEEQDRRKKLAAWLVQPEHPLTARVMANRIWLGHFGQGLVDTPNDFGRNGGKPSHPELLDWLAWQFVESGWSIKHMHRLIVLSATYRQGTSHHPAAAEIDGDDRLYWRYPSRRLEGEAIRDSILAVSGQLNLEMGGSGYNLFDRRGGLTGFNPVESFSAAGLRRMIYAHKVRRERDAIFGAFDCPDAGQSTPRRRESTTPVQALNLFNSQLMLDQSAACAEQFRSSQGDDVVAQITRIYQQALSREPTPEEFDDVRPLVQQYGLAVLCRALFNSNEFLFIP